MGDFETSRRSRENIDEVSNPALPASVPMANILYVRLSVLHQA
jgi:hypothetical protein